MIRDPHSKFFRDDSLFGTIGLFILCVFYLLPAVIMYPAIGWWSLLAGAGVWAVIFTAFKLATRRNRGRS